MVLAARRQPEGEAVAEAIRRTGGEATFVRTDISGPDEVEALHQAAIDKYGRLDCAVYSAAIEGDFPVRTHESSLDNFRSLIEVNLIGAWLCMKHQISHMLN